MISLYPFTTTPVIHNPNTVLISGERYEYNTTVFLNQCQLESGNAAYLFRKEATKGMFDARKLGKEKRDDYSLAGANGEVAFAVMFGTEFNTQLKDGPDATYKGYSVDVKTSAMRKDGQAGWPNLLVPFRHYHENWIYVSTTELSKDEYRINGWIKASDLTEEYISDPGKRGDAWIVPLQALRPMTALIGSKISELPDAEPIF